jgi:3-oxoacyl-[acyl-carrier protein] reductase
MGIDSHSALVVAIVIGGATPLGRDIAVRLASWGWPVVVVYLDRQSGAEAAVAEIIGAGGAAVAVRADLADDLDVQRMFAESIAEFGVVDVVVDTTTARAAPLYEQASAYLREGSVIVRTSDEEVLATSRAAQLREQGIAVVRVSADGVPAFLDKWRQHNHT